MQRMPICTVIAFLAMMVAVGGCSSRNFMVYKNGRSFYITSNCADLKQVLCDSGDMDKIAKASNLPNSLQRELEEGICASGKVKKSLMAILEGMTKEQYAALKEAFRRNGYEINKAADS